MVFFFKPFKPVDVFLKSPTGRYKGNTSKTARLGMPSGHVGVAVRTPPASSILGLRRSVNTKRRSVKIRAQTCRLSDS